VKSWTFFKYFNLLLREKIAASFIFSCLDILLIEKREITLKDQDKTYLIEFFYLKTQLNI